MQDAEARARSPSWGTIRKQLRLETGGGERFRQPRCLLLALVSLSVFPKGRCLSFSVGQAMSRGYQGMGAACNNTWALDQGDAAWKNCSGLSNVGMMCMRRKNMVDQRWQEGHPLAFLQSGWF